MLVLTQSQQMVINVEYVDCMFIGKEIIEKKEKYGLYCIMASDQEKVAIAYYETKKQCIDGTSIRSLTMKKPKTNTSGIKGVSWDKSRNKWVAQIQFKGKNYYLGRYANKEDAREAREKAEKEMFGKFLEEHKEYVKDKKEC